MTTAHTAPTKDATAPDQSVRAEPVVGAGDGRGRGGGHAGDARSAEGSAASGETRISGTYSGSVSSAAELLERARDLYRRGAVGDALVACEQAADEARRTDDVAALADAATVIRTTARVGVAGRVHELCVEALARLGESDPVRTARVRAQLVATANPFGPPEPLDAAARE